jgi:hypothetical protein
MVSLALTTVLTTMWAVFGELLFSVETQNWLVYAPFADRVAYRGICNSALVKRLGQRFESARRLFLLGMYSEWLSRRCFLRPNAPHLHYCAIYLHRSSFLPFLREGYRT